MRIPCGNCGGKVELPAGYSRAKIRCGACGYYAEVPADQRSEAEDDSAPPPARARATPSADAPPAPRPKAASSDAPPPPPRRSAKAQAIPLEAGPVPATPVKARPRPDPVDTRPEFEERYDVGQPILDGDQVEHEDMDDVTPYAVPGTGMKKCPECRGELPLEAVFCVHCGTDFGGGEKKKRSYTAIDESFIEGWGLPLRIGLLVGAQVLNVLLVGGVIVLQLSNEDVKLGPIDFITDFLVTLFHAGLQAFVLGSFDTLRVQRTTTGKVTLTRTRRIAFIPLQGEKLKWKSAQGVGLVASHDADLFAWFVAIYLFLLACVPGLIFYFMVIRPEAFDVSLSNEYGGAEDRAFRSKDRDQAITIAKLIAEATGLKYKKVL